MAKPTIKQLKQDIVFDVVLAQTPLKFRTTWGLFSPREIDEGTHLLLNHLEVGLGDVSLDLGCGYGPIGCWIAANSPMGKIHMVDRDYLAVEYSNTNACLNGLKNCQAYLSNGFSEVPSEVRFNNIVSNIPAKVGRELLLIILVDAHKRLCPGGQIVVVTINGLREFMKNNLKQVFGNYKKLKQGRAYTVARGVKE